MVSSALTFLVPYWSIKPDAAFPAAFALLDLHWIKYLVSVGALCGMTTTLFGSLYSLPRCIYAMADDGLIFKFLAKVNKKTQVRKFIAIFYNITCEMYVLRFLSNRNSEFEHLKIYKTNKRAAFFFFILNRRDTRELLFAILPGTYSTQKHVFFPNVIDLNL